MKAVVKIGLGFIFQSELRQRLRCAAILAVLGLKVNLVLLAQLKSGYLKGMSDPHMTAQGDAVPMLDLFERVAPPDTEALQAALVALQSHVLDAEMQALVTQFIESLKGLPAPEKSDLDWAVSVLNAPPYKAEDFTRLYSIFIRQAWAQIDFLQQLAHDDATTALNSNEQDWLRQKIEALSQGELIDAQEQSAFASYLLRAFNLGQESSL